MHLRSERKANTSSHYLSRRREEADLQRALRLSTQGSVPNSSAVISSSSPLQIPSGFKLAFQSESSPSTHQSGSSEFKGFQGGIFAGLQTPAGHRDSLGTVLSPTMAGPIGSRERPSVQKSASRDPNGKAMKMTSKDATVDVVEGSEDETEEELEQPAKPVSPPSECIERRNNIPQQLKRRSLHQLECTVHMQHPSLPTIIPLILYQPLHPCPFLTQKLLDLSLPLQPQINRNLHHPRRRETQITLHLQ
jgi:hypothetical protein